VGRGHGSDARGLVRKWARQIMESAGVLTKVIKDIELAKELNQQIRKACPFLMNLRHWFGQVRSVMHESTWLSLGAFFEVISAELLDPLYKEHPQIAPTEWEGGDGKKRKA
jgi:hypothetical protein